MSEPENIDNNSLVSSAEEAENIFPLASIKVDFPVNEAEVAQRSLFAQNQVFKEKHIWQLLIRKDNPVTSDKLKKTQNFLLTPEIQRRISNVHSNLTAGHERSWGRAWFTNLMIYPLLKDLLYNPNGDSDQRFDLWEQDWSKGVDPEKFHMVFSSFLPWLGRSPLQIQQEFIAGATEQHPVQESDAEFLAGVFEKVYGEIYDVDKIQAADQRNREFVDKLKRGEVNFSSQDLFHTTELRSLNSIANTGLLCTECTSLTKDTESSFGVSFHMFHQPPKTTKELGVALKSGPDTVRRIDQRCHLAFLNPQESTEEDFILYPPDSFWYDRETRKNQVAGRYIAGYDGRSSEFPDKSIAYVLVGMPSTALSFVMVDEALKADYATRAKKLPFYVPAYSHQGTLLYTPEEYDMAKAA